MHYFVIILAYREKVKLSDVLKSKCEEGEAYLSEFEVRFLCLFLMSVSICMVDT